MRRLSPELLLEWRGWQAPTPVLQRYGWEFALECSDYHRAARLILHHRDCGIASRTEIMDDRLLYDLERGYQRAQTPRIRVENMNFVEERVYDMGDGPIYTHLDMERQPMVDERITSFDPRTLFVERDSGLLVPEDTVPDLLERIQALQEPARQERLREQVRNRARGGIQSVTAAQIIKFGRAA